MIISPTWNQNTPLLLSWASCKHASRHDTTTIELHITLPRTGVPVQKQSVIFNSLLFSRRSIRIMDMSEVNVKFQQAAYDLRSPIVLRSINDNCDGVEQNHHHRNLSPPILVFTYQSYELKKPKRDAFFGCS
ncbi:unnamed protein product [Blumeria hordei]|uniref:Uncharacterized protein n=1 Tax=Blumeria hordei TaxID=2867405 RepID=A0A383UM17_BLUHO|nr:unnamed protein product [Blumeria hordei]